MVTLANFPEHAVVFWCWQLVGQSIAEIVERSTLAVYKSASLHGEADDLVQVVHQ